MKERIRRKFLTQLSGRIESLEERRLMAVAQDDDFHALAGQPLNVPAVQGVLANDLYSPSSASLHKTTRFGSLTLNTDGSFGYTPQVGFQGMDWFEYQADGYSLATVSIEVHGDKQWATADRFTGSHDQPLIGNLLDNDLLPPGRTWDAEILQQPTTGVVTLNEDGTFEFEPGVGYVGTQTFQYRLNDGVLPSDPATVTLVMGNHLPVARQDQYEVAHDGSLEVLAAQGLLSNDSDADSELMTVTSLTNPQHGTLILNANGSFTYTPASGYVGSDSFTYRAHDAFGSTTGTVTIAVTNEVPVGARDRYQIQHDQPLSIAAADGVLANDDDQDLDPITAVVEQAPLHGILSLNANGSFLYTPSAGFVGQDEFKYCAVDPHGQSTPITVGIDVVNANPAAQGDVYTATHDHPLVIAAAAGLLANDWTEAGETLVAIGESTPAHGTLSLQANGSFTYTPAPGYVGPDSFTYRVSDGLTSSGIVTVALEVQDQVPLALGDDYAVLHDQTLNIAAVAGVLANDTSEPGEMLTAQVVSQPAHGTLTFNANGSFTYVPATGYVGSDQFTYRFSDGTQWSEAVSVSLSVRNARPRAEDDLYTLATNGLLTTTAVTGTRSNDNDDAGDATTISLTADVEHGTLVLNANGSFSYTPDSGFVGTDRFRYQLSDGLETSRVATVTLVVSDQAVVSRDDSYEVQHDQANTINATGGVLANDWNAAAGSMSAVLVANATHGSVSLAANGGFTYTPASGYIGEDSFTYRAQQGANLGPVTTVHFDVINNAPVGNVNQYEIPLGTTLSVPTAQGLLSNDGDDSGETLTAVLENGPWAGTLNLSADGSLTYTPASYIGQFTFTYRVSDGLLQSEPIMVTLNVVNTAPRASDDSYRTPHSQGLIVNATEGVLANDVDAAGQTLTASIWSWPSHGSLSLGSDGSFVYTPYSGYSGPDQFTYGVNDGYLNSSAIVRIEVVNDAPFAADDIYSVLHDTALVVGIEQGIAANDGDPNFDTLSPQLANGPSHGGLTLNSDGSFAYTPHNGFVGTDSFTYRANDGSLLSDEVLVTIQVRNTAPVSGGDQYDATHDQPLVIAAEQGVLSNDGDLDEDELTIQTMSYPSHGSLSMEADGGFTYTPAAGYVGPDSFTYRLFDGAVYTQPVTVHLDVVNSAPRAGGDSYLALHDAKLRVRAAQGVLQNDVDDEQDTLTITVQSWPQHGSLTLRQDGSFDYTPATSYSGPDSFTYVLNDGAANSQVATVALQVQNQAPVGRENSYRVLHDTALTVNAPNGVRADDFDADADPLTLTLLTDVEHGMLSLNQDGSFVYTPAAGYFGQDSFVYRLSDGVDNTGPVRVQIRVENSAPVASLKIYSVLHDTALNVPAGTGLLHESFDLDGDDLTIAIAVPPAHGDVTIAADGSFVYTPDADFAGDDSFVFTLSDGAQSSQAEVRIRVTDTPPWAAADVYSVLHDHTLNVTAGSGVLANDQNTDGDALTLSVLTDVAHGTLTLNANGSFSYLPDADFVGRDEFRYEIEDTRGNVSVATATISVTNSAPTADGLVFSTSPGVTLSVSNPVNGLLSSASDSDAGDTLTFELVDSPANGILTVLDAAGRFTYDPDSGFSGVDTFTYRVSDGINPSNLATVVIRVGNAPATSAADHYYIATNGTLTITANRGTLANDLADAGETLTASLVTNPSSGSVTLNSDGSFTYTPNSSFAGVDSFTYQATDSIGAGTAVTVTVTVGSATYLATNDAFTVRRTGAGTPAVLDGANGLLSNDLGTGGATLVIVSAPSHGTLQTSGGAITGYVPDAGYSGTDSFTYKLQVGGVDSNTASVTLIVPNLGNTAGGDSYRTRHDEPLTVLAGDGLLANDHDDNDDTLTAQVIAGPSNGSLTLNGDGSFTYTPAAGYVGSDSFTYEVTDGTLTSSPATVYVEVWNNDPIGISESYRIPHDQVLTVAAAGVLANDEKDEGETLTAILVSGPSHGGLSLATNGSFVYTPNAGWTGWDSFTYKPNDGADDGAAVTVSIEVWNMVPIGTPNLYHVHHDDTLTIPAGRGVIANDVDSDGDVLVVTLVGMPAHGLVTLSGNGAFVYTPAAGFAGMDGFTYTLTDGAAVVGPVTVSIDVWNTQPGTASDNYRVHHGETLEASVSEGVSANDWDDDGDTRTVSLVSGPAQGNLNLAADGSFTYTPPDGYVGTQSFTYQVTDGVVIIGPVSVSIDVRNKAPVGNSDAFSIHHDETLTGSPSVLANDWDGDADPKTATLVSDVSHGSLTFNEDGTFSYTPTSGYVGGDSFTYKVNDGAQDSSPVSVTIDVWNNIPTAHGNYYQVQRGETLEASSGEGVLSDDSDWDGDTVTATLVSTTSHGTLTLNSDGSFNYEPDEDFTGTDSFTYRATDGAQTTGDIPVTIEVLNHAPFAFDDKFVFHHTETSFTGNVATDDWDADGDSLEVELVYNVSVGTLSLSASGAFTFTPPEPHWTGIATFTYKLKDGSLESRHATAVIEVRNRAPVALGDSYRTKHGTTLSKSAGDGVLKNDFDGDSQDSGKLKAYVVSGAGPSHAQSFKLNTDGSFNYVPDPAFHGEDSFSYKVFDGAAYGGPISVQLLVDNTKPMGRMDLFKMPKSGTMTVSAAQLKANDIDFDAGDLANATITIVEQPKYGSLTASGDGWKYAPNLVGNSLAFDSFTYKLNDGIEDSDPVLVVFTLLEDQWGTFNDEYRVVSGKTLSVSSKDKGVLGNDWTSSSEALKATLVSGPSNGSLTLNENGTFDYTPNSTFTGTDYFTYKIRDGFTATANIKVVALDPNDDTYTIKHDRRLISNLLGNDTGSNDEPLRAVVQTQPGSGKLELTPDGNFVYTPNAGFTGEDTFTYKVTNGSETSSDTATVKVTVENSAPSGGYGGYGGVSDSYSTSTQQPLVVGIESGVLANDTDADGDILKAELVSGVASSAGSLTLNDDGSFTFIPADKFQGTASFSYKAFDGVAYSPNQTVNILVSNNAPGVSSHSYSVYHDETLSVGAGRGVLRSASDEFRHQLKAKKISGPSHGTVTVNEDGSFTYTPTAGYVGPDSFTYKATDATETDSSEGTVSIQVVNQLSVGPWKALPLDEFTAVGSYSGSCSGGGGYGGGGYGGGGYGGGGYGDYGGGYGGYGGGSTCSYGAPIGSISGDVLDSPADGDGDPLSVSIASSLAGLSLSSDGSFSYTGYGGSFSFYLSDGLTQSGPYTVNLIVLSPGSSSSPSEDTTLEAGQAFYSGGRMWVYNYGPGTIEVTGYSTTSASLAPVSGTNFAVAVYYGHANWSGEASGSLSLSAAGNVSSISISGDLSVSAGGNVGNVSGKNVSAHGDNIGTVDATEDVNSANAYGGWSGYGSVNKWSSASGLGTIGTINAGERIHSVQTATVGVITAGTSIGSISAYTLSSSITATAGDIDDVTAARDISGAIFAGGDIGYDEWWYEGIRAGGNISGAIDADGSISSVTAGGNISSTITAGGDIGEVHADKSISGAISGVDISTVSADDDIASGGSVTASQYLGSASAGRDILGSLTANGQQGYGGYGGYGGLSIGSITSGRDISGAITGAYGIGSISAGRTLSSTVSTTNGPINTISAWQISGASLTTAGGGIGSVNSTRNVDGTINSGAEIGTITAGRNVGATITAATNINAINAGLDLTGSVTATAGDIQTVNAKESIEGAITAGGSIADVDAGHSISGNVTAGQNLGEVDADHNISGNIKATAGDITFVYAGKIISGNIEAGDDIKSGVSAGGNLTGNVKAGRDISSVKAGYRRDYWYWWWWGVSFDVTGGNIQGSTIEAGGDIGTVEAGWYNGTGGKITGATIEAKGGHVSNVVAGDDIDATITAQTYVGSVGQGSGGAGDITGTITAKTEYIGTVDANFGKISAAVDAKTYVTSITATDDITGKITAGTYIGSEQYTQGVVSKAGKITGNIEAGTDIGIVSAGKHIEGTITAGDDIGKIVAGTAGGGNITKEIKATGSIGSIVALGPWAEGAKRSVHERSSAASTAQWTTNTDKPTSAQRPRPNAIPLAPGDYGNIQGQVSAEDISSITAFGDIAESVTTTKTLGPVWALKDIKGDLKAGEGGLTAEAWKDISGDVTAKQDITLKSWGNMSGEVRSKKGSVTITSWADVKGLVVADKETVIWAFNNAAGDAESTRGGISVTALNESLGKIKSLMSAGVWASKIANKGVLSTLADAAIFGVDNVMIQEQMVMLGKAWVVSVGDVKLPFLTGVGIATWGEVNILAWGNVDVDTIWANDINIWAAGNVDVGASASGAVKIEAKEVAGHIGNSDVPETVFIHAAGDIKAKVDAKTSIDVLSLGKITGNFDAKENANAWIGAVAIGDITGTMHAIDSVGLQTWGKLSGAVTTDTGAIQVTAFGVSSSEITAGGLVNVISWGSVNSNITANNGYIELLASGNVNGTIKAKGDINLETFGDLSGSVTAGNGGSSQHQATADVTVHGDSSATIKSSHDVTVEVFGQLQGTIEATAGNAAVGVYGAISGATIKAAKDISAVSWTNLDGSTIKSSEGGIYVWSDKTTTSLTVEAQQDITVNGAQSFKGTLTSKEGNVDVAVIQDIQSGTNVTAKQGSINLFAGGDADFTATAGTSSASQSVTMNVDVGAKGNIKGTIKAQGSVDVISLNTVDLNATSHRSSVVVFADGSLKGTYTGKSGVTATSLGAAGGSTEGTYKSGAGDVSVVSLVAFNGTVDAKKNGSVIAQGDIQGSIKGGENAGAFSSKQVSATVNSGTNATVYALDGSVTGTVTASRGSAVITAAQQLTASVTAYENVSVVAMQGITGSVNATRGNASVITMGSISSSVTAGGNADVFAKTSVSGSVDAGQNATVATLGAVSGTVTAGKDAQVISLGSVSGNVTAESNASVFAKETVSGDVTATSGFARVVTGAELTGNVTAGQNAMVFALGNITGTTSAGVDADVTTWGELQGSVSADRDATVWSFGAISAAIDADRNAHVTAFDEINSSIEAGQNANVTTYATLSGNVTAGQNASVWVMEELTGSVTATAGSVSAISIGEMSGQISAGTNVTVTTLGNLTSPIDAGGDISATVLSDSVEADMQAGGSVRLMTTGSATGEITAGASINVVSLDGADGLNATADQDITIFADGAVNGTITATNGNATVAATGEIASDVDAGGDASVTTLQNITANITAAGSIEAFSLAQITGSEISGDAAVFVWAQGGLSGLTLNSANGGVTALANGSITGTTISATGDVLIASVGSTVNANVDQANHVRLFGLGVTSDIAAQGNVFAASYGALTLNIATAGDLRTMSTGVHNVNGTVGGNAVLVTYSTLTGNVTAGNNLSAWSLGTISGDLVAANVIERVVTYASLTGSLQAGAIHAVYIWGDLTGSVTAVNFIGEIFTGGEVTTLAVIVAPHIGQIVEHDRSPFVEDPMTPIAEIGSILSLIQNARASLLQMQEDVQATKTELLEMGNALVAELQNAIAQATEELNDAKQAADTQLQDIETQAQASLGQAEKQAARALEVARVALEAGKKQALDSAQVAKQEVEQDLVGVTGEAAARQLQAQEYKEFLKEEATLLFTRMQTMRSAQVQQAAMLKMTHTQVFVATFMTQMVEYHLDVLQEKLEEIAFVADFIPGVGNLVSAIADGVNAAIYAARGKWFDAAATAVAMIPFGSIAKKIGLADGAQALAKAAFKQVGNVVQASSKFIKSLPLGAAARMLPCPVRKVFGLPGCFVAGTEVVMGGTVVGGTFDVAVGEQDASYLNNVLAVTLVGIGLGGYVIGKRKLRDRHREAEQAHRSVFDNLDDDALLDLTFEPFTDAESLSTQTSNALDDLLFLNANEMLAAEPRQLTLVTMKTRAPTDAIAVPRRATPEDSLLVEAEIAGIQCPVEQELKWRFRKRC